ncbi:hypothetical protein QBA75_34870 [Streptomyces stelliscabiei]
MTAIEIATAPAPTAPARASRRRGLLRQLIDSKKALTGLILLALFALLALLAPVLAPATRRSSTPRAARPPRPHTGSERPPRDRTYSPSPSGARAAPSSSGSPWGSWQPRSPSSSASHPRTSTASSTTR